MYNTVGYSFVCFPVIDMNHVNTEQKCNAFTFAL